jgi:hypothetical protein
MAGDRGYDDYADEWSDNYRVWLLTIEILAVGEEHYAIFRKGYDRWLKDKFPLANGVVLSEAKSRALQLKLMIQAYLSRNPEGDGTVKARYCNESLAKSRPDPTGVKGKYFEWLI